MALKLTAVALAAMIQHVQSHVTFVRIAHNGEWKEPLRYIRNKTAPFEEPNTPYTNVNTRGYHYPTYVTDLPESVRCGRDNMAHAANTEVLTVKAGDTIEFAQQLYDPVDWEDNNWYGCPYERGSCRPGAPKPYMGMSHDGPVVAHLSKVPDGQDVHEYDGSGEWLKIANLGLEMRPDLEKPVHWLAYNNGELPGRFVFKIPTQTPAGQYLLRPSLVWQGMEWPEANSSALAQLFPSCAQISVESEFGGSLPQGGISIPEDFSHTSPGMKTSLDMYRSLALDEDYVYPGGPLWDGEKLVQDKPVA